MEASSSPVENEGNDVEASMLRRYARPDPRSGERASRGLILGFGLVGRADNLSEDVSFEDEVALDSMQTSVKQR